MSYLSLRQNKSLQKQQGVAIIVALFIVALVATMAYLMMTSLQRDTERTDLIVRNTQAEMSAQGSILWAMNTLQSNWEKQQPKRMIDRMPVTSPIDTVNGFQVHSTIEDMQGRFNINNLANNVGLNEFVRLLQVIDPELNQEKAMAIMQAVIVWVSRGAPNHDYNEFYFAQAVPYRNAGRIMQTIAEFSMIKGITPKLYRSLLPYLSALPESTKMNVQTALAPVLMTLSPSMTTEMANQLILMRATQPFVSVDDFMNLDVIKNNHIATDQITTTSSYFLVTTEVKIEDQRLVIYTLMQRVTKDKKAKVNILWQSKGSY